MKPRCRCDLCGRFKKETDIALIEGEDLEQWLECKECMSQSDRETYFKEENEKTKAT